MSPCPICKAPHGFHDEDCYAYTRVSETRPPGREAFVKWRTEYTNAKRS